MSNLNVKMMVAYHADDLLGAVTEKILEDPNVHGSFQELCNMESNDNSLVQTLKKYIVVKFKRMRARWFVKAIRGQTAKGTDAVAKMATRAKVAANSKAAKAAKAAKAEVLKSEEDTVADFDLDEHSDDEDMQGGTVLLQKPTYKTET